MRLAVTAVLAILPAAAAVSQTTPGRAPPPGGEDQPAGRVVINGPTNDPRLAAFAKSDANKDGKLDKTEFGEMAKALGAGASAETIRAQVDTNKDGFVTLPEYATSLGGNVQVRQVGNAADRQAAFKANDKNQDGKLSKDEYAALIKQMGMPVDIETIWPQRDVNKDGFVTEDEMARPVTMTMSGARPQ